jgi:hypothetical protein
MVRQDLRLPLHLPGKPVPERPDDGPVDRTAETGGEGRQDRLPEKGMGEVPDRILAGKVLLEESPGREVSEAFAEAFRGNGSARSFRFDRHEKGEGEGGTEAGRRLEGSPLLPGIAQPGGKKVPERGGKGFGRTDRGFGPGQLPEKERDPLSPVQELPETVGGEGCSGCAFDQEAGRSPLEPAKDNGEIGRGEVPGGQGRLVPGGEEEKGGSSFFFSGPIPEEFDRRVVGPVKILDRQKKGEIPPASKKKP